MTNARRGDLTLTADGEMVLRVYDGRRDELRDVVLPYGALETLRPDVAEALKGWTKRRDEAGEYTISADQRLYSAAFVPFSPGDTAPIG